MTPVYVAYDYCMKFVYGWLRRRMKKTVSKYLHPEKRPTASTDEDVFGIEEAKDDHQENAVDSVKNPTETLSVPNTKPDEKDDKTDGGI